MKKHDKLAGKNIFEYYEKQKHSIPESTTPHSIPIPIFTKVKKNILSSNKRNNSSFGKSNSNKTNHNSNEHSDKIKQKDTTEIPKSLRIKDIINRPKTTYKTRLYKNQKASKKVDLFSASANIIRNINNPNQQKKRNIKNRNDFLKKCLSVENEKTYSFQKIGNKKYKERLNNTQSNKGNSIFNNKTINNILLKNKINKNNKLNNSNFTSSSYKLPKNDLFTKPTSLDKNQKINPEKKQNKLKISLSNIGEEKCTEENILSKPNTFAFDHHFQKRYKKVKNITEKKNKEEKQQNSNIELSQKTEEKITILLPGQTVEPKNVSEIIEDPIEEVIQYPDGTTNTIIKQTKITKIVENFPIEVTEKNNLNGKKLSAVKQVITYYYKTVHSEKEDVFDTKNDSKKKENKDDKINYDEKEKDKQKNIDYYKYLYKNSSCDKGEFYENLVILSNHLSLMKENDRKRILNELNNMEPKNEQLYEKLLELLKVKEISNKKIKNLEGKNNKDNRPKLKNPLRKHNSKKLNENKTWNNKQLKRKKDINIFKDDNNDNNFTELSKMTEKNEKTNTKKNIAKMINILIEKNKIKNAYAIEDTETKEKNKNVKSSGKNIKVFRFSHKFKNDVDKCIEKLQTKGLLDDDFFDRSKYVIRGSKDKNPFDGPSSLDKYNKGRSGKIKEKSNK